MKIDVESHVSSPENDVMSARHRAGEAARNGVEYMAEVRRRFVDVSLRLESMEKNGIGHSVVSLSSAGAQGIANPAEAVSFARAANDFIAENYPGRHPGQFSAMAAIPIQCGEAAARELERAVHTLGARGALIRGWSNFGDGVMYADHRSTAPFWAAAAELNVPVYLHPREPAPGAGRRIYEDYPALLGSAWAFAMETATVAMRLMMSDIFDKNPKLQVILGHLGEALSFLLPRAQHRLDMQRGGIGLAEGKKPLPEYFKNNFHLTTSGHFDTPALRSALAAVGPERVMFATDYPLESAEVAAAWFDKLDLPGEDFARIAAGNAKKLFKLN